MNNILEINKQIGHRYFESIFKQFGYGLKNLPIVLFNPIEVVLLVISYILLGVTVNTSTAVLLNILTFVLLSFVFYKLLTPFALLINLRIQGVKTYKVFFNEYEYGTQIGHFKYSYPVNELVSITVNREKNTLTIINTDKYYNKFMFTLPNDSNAMLSAINTLKSSPVYGKYLGQI